MTKPHLENFFLSKAFLDSMDEAETIATFEAMCECDIAHGPFIEFCVTVPEEVVIRSSDTHKPFKDAEFRNMEFHFWDADNLAAEPPRVKFEVYSNDLTKKRKSLDWIHAAHKAVEVGHWDEEQYEVLKGHFANYAAVLLKYLCVALATKGVQKDRVKNKLAALGIGKNKPGGKYSYTTTISVGRVEEDPDHIPNHTGRTVRPHLRRGHVRHQHFGPDRAFIKKIFIEAVFVNSDREYVSFRDRYNVSLGGHTMETSND